MVNLPGRRASPGPESRIPDTRERLKAGLGRLGSRDRQVLYLRLWLDRSWDEVATEMQLGSPDAARMRYRRALKRLQTLLPD